MKIEKDRSEYFKQWRLANPEKIKAAQKKFRDNNKEYMSTRQRKYQLRDKYGITEEDYNRMFTEQNGKCAICETSEQTGKWQRFGVDHCHITGKIRQLLCNECNRGMGLLKDNAMLLRKAADYLDKHSTKE